jgi:hypothetical protein
MSLLHNLHFSDLLTENKEKDYLKNLVNNICESRYIVNIGCADGITSDPLNVFNNDFNYTGLYIDGDPICVKKAQENMSHNYTVIQSFVTPDNILEIFLKYNVPKTIDILKIDIDGYDLSIIRKILKHDYVPKIIISEINEKIPPPIKFEVLFNDSYTWGVDHFYGYSLAQGYDFYNNNNYHVVSLYDMNNVLCINKNIYDSKKKLIKFSLPVNVNILYNEGYVKYKSKFPWNKDVDHWLSISSNAELLNTIKNYFTIVTKKTINKDFILS